MRDILIAAALIAGTITIGMGGCSSPEGDARGGENVGSIGMTLTLPEGITLSQLNWTITDSGGRFFLTSQSSGQEPWKAATANGISFIIGGIPQGYGYTITLTGTDSIGESCTGSADFGIKAGWVSTVAVSVVCSPPSDAGAAEVTNGSLFVEAGVTRAPAPPPTHCPGINVFSVMPAEIASDSSASFAISAAGTPYVDVLWTATAGGASVGSLSHPHQERTAFSCAGFVGTATVSVTLSSTSACLGVPNTTASALVVCDAPSGAGQPYEIYDASQFVNLITNHPDGYFVLMRDIDLTGVSPIDRLSGTLEGHGHVLSNFSYSGDANDDSIGLFRTVTGSIHNLLMENCVIQSYAQHVGCLVGSLLGSVTDAGVISGGVTCTGDINENTAWACGGLIGGLDLNGVVERDYSLVSVSGGHVYSTGGLVGGALAGAGGIYFTISNSYAAGSVSGAWLVGGLTGGQGGGDSKVFINNCHAYGRAEGTDGGNENLQGGLIGISSLTACNFSYYNAINSRSGCGEALADFQFIDPSSFAGWDFQSVWKMGLQYPILRSPE